MKSGDLDGADTSWPRADAGATIAHPEGPAPMPDDSWDQPLAGDTERYQGRRRARQVVARRPVWVGSAAVLATVVAVVALASTRSSGFDGARQSRSPATADGTSATDGPALGPAATGPRSGPSVPSASAASSALVSGEAAGQAGPKAGRQASPFTEVTIEAEAGPPATSLTGSAQVVADPDASGGQLVTGLGNGGGPQGPGTLRIAGLDIPSAGTYQISFYFTTGSVRGRQTAVMDVTGAQSITVSFAGGPTCCGVRTVELALAAGPIVVTISNPTGAAPSIDKIVLSRP